jgi:hypothetical protein
VAGSQVPESLKGRRVDSQKNDDTLIQTDKLKNIYLLHLLRYQKEHIKAPVPPRCLI